MIDLEAIREISHSSSTIVCVRDDDHLVPSVDELRRKLIDVAFDPAWLWKEVITDHRNIVRHCGGGEAALPAGIWPEEQY